MRLNFACGDRVWDGFENSDINGHPGTVRVDLEEFPYPYEDDSADVVMISHGLFMGKDGAQVHPNLVRIFAEFHRILCPGGWLRIDDNPWRCYDETVPLPSEVSVAESARGYPSQWRIPRARLRWLLKCAGFPRLYDTDTGTTRIPVEGDARAAVLGNHKGHETFTIEAQK